jgi:hypothetical protein
MRGTLKSIPQDVRVKIAQEMGRRDVLAKISRLPLLLGEGGRYVSHF